MDFEVRLDTFKPSDPNYDHASLQNLKTTCNRNGAYESTEVWLSAHSMKEPCKEALSTPSSSAVAEELKQAIHIPYCQFVTPSLETYVIENLSTKNKVYFISFKQP